MVTCFQLVISDVYVYIHTYVYFFNVKVLLWRFQGQTSSSQ